MSVERISIELTRVDDAWSADVSGDELVEQHFAGDGPADVLEQVGQELDVREVARIKRERGL